MLLALSASISAFCPICRLRAWQLSSDERLRNLQACYSRRGEKRARRLKALHALLQLDKPRLVEPSAELLELFSEQKRAAMFPEARDLFQPASLSTDFEADAITALRFHLRVAYNDLPADPDSATEPQSAMDAATAASPTHVTIAIA